MKTLKDIALELSAVQAEHDRRVLVLVTEVNRLLEVRQILSEKINNLQIEKGEHPEQFNSVTEAVRVAVLLIYGDNGDKQRYMRKVGWKMAEDTSWRDPKLDGSSCSWHIATDRQMGRVVSPFKWMLKCPGDLANEAEKAAGEVQVDIANDTGAVA